MRRLSRSAIWEVRPEPGQAACGVRRLAPSGIQRIHQSVAAQSGYSNLDTRLYFFAQTLLLLGQGLIWKRVRGKLATPVAGSGPSWDVLATCACPCVLLGRWRTGVNCCAGQSKAPCSRPQSDDPSLIFSDSLVSFFHVAHSLPKIK